MSDDFESRLSAIGERSSAWMQKREPERADPILSLDDYLSFFNWAGLSYPFIQRQTLGQRAEWPDPTFEGYVQGIYRADAVVFACMLRRLQCFSEGRFMFQRMRAGRPGDLYGLPELAILEHPWPGATTGDLLARAIQDCDIGGQFFCVRRGGRLLRLRPDWVTIVAGSPNDPPSEVTSPYSVEVDPNSAKIWDIDSQLIGYIYQPGGPHVAGDPEFLQPEEVCHFAPIPDPWFRFRGISWLTPILREVMADQAATTHKYNYFINGATPNMVVTLDSGITPEKFNQWVDKFERKHAGVQNAYKTLYLVGAKAEVVGSDMQQIDFKATQGTGETRICAASGVPAVLAGVSEGLASATYSNYSQARHAFGDMTIRPLWRNFCGSMEQIINVPSDSRLWYDVRDVPFLRQDATDEASIAHIESTTIQTLIVAGYKPDSVIDAVTNKDWTRLIHTGLYSVQLQPPQTQLPLPLGQPAPNGKPANGTPAPA